MENKNNSIVLRCILCCSWLLPLIGVPLGIYGTYSGGKNTDKKLLIVAIVSLALAIVNAIIGACMAMH